MLRIYLYDEKLRILELGYLSGSKHTQTIRRQKLTNCLSVLDHFGALALKRLISYLTSMPLF